MNTQTITLDVSKRPSVVPVLYLRQGDKSGTTLRVEMYDNGSALPLSGRTVMFRMRAPKDRGYYEKSGGVSGNVATFTIDETYAATYPGITDTAYVDVLEGSSVIASTGSFRVVVLEDATEGVDPNTAYTNGIAEWLEDATEQLNDVSGRAEEAIEAIGDISELAVPLMSADTRGGAKLGSGLAVDGGALRADLTKSGSGRSVTAEHGAMLAELTVYGESVQDGTPTPDAPVEVQVVKSINLAQPLATGSNNSYGVTWTMNADGTFSAVGTSTNSSVGTFGATHHDKAFGGITLKPGSYVVRASNPSVKVRIGKGENASFVASGASTVTFTVSTANVYYISPYVDSGVTINDGAITVQLERGSTPTPYVPYGSIGLLIGDDVTPIDLQGNVLASLPDGTRDRLLVDSAGHVTLEKRVEIIEGGEAGTSAYYTSTNHAKAIVFSSKPYPGGINSLQMLSDQFEFDGPKSGDASGAGMDVGKFGYYYVSSGATPWYIYIQPAETITSQAEVATWLTTHKPKFYYPLATPETIDLGYIDPPTITEGDVISVSAEVVPVIDVAWWERGAEAIGSGIIAVRDLLLEKIAELQEAIADITA